MQILTHILAVIATGLILLGLVYPILFPPKLTDEDLKRLRD